MQHPAPRTTVAQRNSARSVETGAPERASLAGTFKSTAVTGSARSLLIIIMTFPEYLDPGRSDSAAWPSGEKTWKLLLTIGLGAQIRSTGGSAYEGLLTCYALLQRLVQDDTAHRRLRDHVTRHPATNGPPSSILSISSREHWARLS